jgi:DNA-binding MarR family transcriptional regulator
MPTPYEDLSLQLVKLFRALRGLRVAVVEAGGHHLDASAVGLLAGLSTLGPARLSTLATEMWLDLSTISRQVPALERQGWVVRKPDPDDHRAQLLELTDGGRTMLDTIRRGRAEVLEQLLPDWTADDLRNFAQQLSRFNADVTTNRPAALPAALPALTGSTRP